MPGRNALSFLFEMERAFHPPGLATLPLQALPFPASRAPFGASPLANVAYRLPLARRSDPFRPYPMGVCNPTFQSPELRKHSGVGLDDLCAT